MVDFNNDYAYDNRFTTKSKINKKDLVRFGLSKDVSLQTLKKAFDDCNYIGVKVGMPYTQFAQKFTKYVYKGDLINRANFLHKQGVQQKMRFKK